ncbi:hypothetical protein RND71_020704 [Anisodus tanguticus]|uniref:Uncharacterized protein n=1 Tax=Anisodus tanguticus TaxID=243964 RepID=A0AAE1RUF7_9SOLA|nr:hypothetical protein RND71_020704 [Anisodus tanguticus]
MQKDGIVMTVKYPMDALSTLRCKSNSFDLVITNVHVPGMNGLEFQQVITQEFQLPVMLMSAEDKDGTILKGLMDGAAVFIAKPMSNDLRDLWQYAALQDKKGKRPVVEERESIEKSSNCNKRRVHEVGESASYICENCHQHIKKGTSKRKSAIKQGNADIENSANYVVPKKAKVKWTMALHNKFLVAITEIGFDRVAPLNILDHMKVPGLTRDNVASHLQRYRIFLRKVIDASCKTQAADKNLASKAVQENRRLEKQVLGNTSNPSSSIHTKAGYLTGNLQHLKNKGKEVDAVLDPVCNSSLFHNINATQETQRIGDLSTSFMNQGNVQPHQQNKEDEMNVNFDGGINQDMEEDYLQ